MAAATRLIEPLIQASIRLTTVAVFSGRKGERANGTAVLDCAPGEKLDLLRELMNGQLSFENVETIDPSLEQVFAAHTADGGQR